MMVLIGRILRYGLGADCGAVGPSTGLRCANKGRARNCRYQQVNSDGPPESHENERRPVPDSMQEPHKSRLSLLSGLPWRRHSVLDNDQHEKQQEFIDYEK